MASTLGNLNPFRYRGYVYDTETELYYLQTRYYDAEVGRCISADIYISTGLGLLGNNMYIYCLNNPIDMKDSAGMLPDWLETTIKVAAVIAVGAAAAAVVATITVGTGGAGAIAAGIALGAFSGGLVGGIANESKGESFANGWVGGFANGLIQSSATALMNGLGTIIGGRVGSGIGTAITETLNNTNKPPVNRKTNKEIWKASATSAGIGLATSGLTAGMNYAITSATPGGYGLMPQLTKGFSEMMKGFFGSVDDAIIYALCK